MWCVTWRKHNFSQLSSTTKITKTLFPCARFFFPSLVKLETRLREPSSWLIHIADGATREARANKTIECYLHVCVQNEIASGVAEGKVVAGQLALLWVECQLVAGEPSLVANDTRCIDQRSGEIDVDVAIQTDALVWVGCLEASGFASKFVHEINGRWRLVNDTSVADCDATWTRDSVREWGVEG